MIGQLVNVSKPLSPVTFAQSEPNQLANGFEASIKQEDEYSNKIEKFGSDLDTILEQISRVSPLLSPIVNITTLNEKSDSLDNLKEEIKAAISKSDQNEFKNRLKRPNTNEDNSHVPTKRPVLQVEQYPQNVKKEVCSTKYSIKLRTASINKLASKFYPQKEQIELQQEQEVQSEKSVDCSTANASTPIHIENQVENQVENGGNTQQSDNMSDQPTNMPDSDLKIGFPTPDGKTSPFEFFQTRARDIRKKSDQEV
uniref:Uncharacterized protein n=1 Tax=Meloidogyne hapla TaxID=6305 RepID=A0A1I8B1A0_MELHA